MRTNYCHQFLSFNLKFLNFLQFFVGISAVIFSAYLLNQWHSEGPPIVPSPPPDAPPPDYFIPGYGDQGIDRVSGVELVSGLDSGLGLGLGLGLDSQLYSFRLPTPWFIYFLMVAGVLLCLMSCIGHIAAEAINGCCLCFYILLEFVIILMEAALVAFIGIDRHWEKDLPFDETGELGKLKSFIEKYADICKWLGIALLIVQALSLLLSLVLRAMISTRANSDVENNYVDDRERTREPLFNSQPNQAAGLTKNDGKESHSNMWANLMRQKYGLKNESSEGQSSSS